MLLNDPVIRVIVPTLNNAADLDATVESVLAQDYDGDKIFMTFVDFGSIDGTLEKLLRYPKKQTGVFSLAGKRIGRTMIADAARMYDFQRIGGRELLLWPGDVLYPHCLKTAEKYLRMVSWGGTSASLLVAEADIRGQDGIVRKQTPLFTGPCHLRSYSLDSSEYAVRGYKHPVITYGHGYNTVYTKGESQRNQRYIWNHLAYLGLNANAVYANKTLGCLRERRYEDELDEIVFLFEAGLTCFRMAAELPDGFVLDKQFENGYRKQLAYYALWRAFLLHGRKQCKDAEDCFLFSGVVWPGIYEEECWKTMERLIERGEEVARIQLEAFFSREDAPAKPKWPVSGNFLARIWRMVRQRYGRDRQSAWGR